MAERSTFRLGPQFGFRGLKQGEGHQEHKGPSCPETVSIFQTQSEASRDDPLITGKFWSEGGTEREEACMTHIRWLPLLLT